MNTEGFFVMRMSTVAFVFTAAFCAAGATVPRPVQAAALVKECAPPGGNWGPGGNIRSKIQVFADNTAVYMTQNFGTPTPDRWWTARFPATGGKFTNAFGYPDAVTPEGDGYKVEVQTRTGYSAHFGCVAAARK